MDPVDKVTYEIIDLLAREYGWSIKYIQNLDMREINGLLESIVERKKQDAIVLIYAIRTAFNGGELTSSEVVNENAIKKLINSGIAKMTSKETDKGKK
ncbi:MAG: hypothetical protein ACFFAU_01280 [Candidatus Hodarchaeota archaeon]